MRIFKVSKIVIKPYMMVILLNFFMFELIVEYGVEGTEPNNIIDRAISGLKP